MSFQYLTFFPKVSSSTTVKSILEKVKHYLCQENEHTFIFHEMHSLYLHTKLFTKSLFHRYQAKRENEKNCKGNSKENYFFSHSFILSFDSEGTLTRLFF